MEKPGFIKDPVCGIQVDPHQNAIVYLDIPYAFCSKQCLERFQTHPHLYIGQPGIKAPRQAGQQLIKRRSLRLAKPLEAEQATKVAEALTELPGIKQVQVDMTTLTLTYDLLVSTTEQIEQKLAEAGIRLGDGWADRLRLAFVHYEEELESSGMEVNDKNL